MRNAVVAALVAIVLPSLAHAAEPATPPAEPPPPAPVVRAYKAPAPDIDGSLRDVCWSQASWMHPFLTHPDGRQAAHESSLAVSFDDKRFYVIVRCESPDPQLLRAADGDPGLNDRVELFLTWPDAAPQSLLVDAAGRVRASKNLTDARAATRTQADGYVVEVSVPRPEDARSVQCHVRRTNKVLGEVSGWGAAEAPMEAILASRPGPFVTVRDVPQYTKSEDPLKLLVTNPTDNYVTVRCRVTTAEYATSVPHLIRLSARKSVPVSLAYKAKDVVRQGLQIVVDEPSGREIYLRSPHLRAPIGKAPATSVVDVIPHPASVSVNAEAATLILDSSFRIYVTSTRNAPLLRAAQMVRDKIKERTGLALPIKSIGLFTSFDKTLCLATAVAGRNTFKRVGRKFGMAVPQARPDQSYGIAVTTSKIGLLAHGPRGILNAALTFVQLLDTASAVGPDLLIPLIRVTDSPAFTLRGCLWREPTALPPSIYAAMESLKLNCLTAAPGADAAAAQAHGVFLVSPPAPPARGASSEALAITLTPSDDMPRDMRRSLRLPVALLGTGARPSDKAAFDIRIEHAVEAHVGPLRRDDAKPVAIAWAPAEFSQLLHASRWGAPHPNVVGLCGELRPQPLLPPSWMQVALAAEYGWSPALPDLRDYERRFYRVFYGAADLHMARRYFERAVASLPRHTSLRALLDPTRPANAPPRSDLEALLKQARDLCLKATRNKDLAAALGASAPRVLAAATNAAAAARTRALLTEIDALAAKKQGAAVAKRFQSITTLMTESKARMVALLGPQAVASPDAQLYTTAAAIAGSLSRQCSQAARLPASADFWKALQGAKP